MTPVNSRAQIQGGNGGGFGNGNNRGQVVVYSGIKYTGLAKQLGPGNFTPRKLGFGMAGNISSIIIPSGMYADVTDARGQRYRLTSSSATLSSIGWDNRIVAGFIGSNTPGTGDGQHGGNGPGFGSGDQTTVVVTLHYDLDMTGKAVNFAVGTYKYLGLNVDKNITSLTVAPGYAVRVYDQQNLRGRSQIFGQSVSDLRRYNWDNRVASMVVYRTNQSAQANRPVPFGKQ